MSSLQDCKVAACRKLEYAELKLRHQVLIDGNLLIDGVRNTQILQILLRALLIHNVEVVVLSEKLLGDQT